MKPKGNNIAGLNVGKLIDTERRRQRITHALLARRTDRKQPGIARILKADSIQTYLVWELSVALNHNFFTDLAQQLDTATEGKLQAQQTELEQLKLEHAKLQEEHAYLKKAIDLLGDK